MKSANLWFTGLAVLLITSLVQAGTVYQWTDENGVRHFSNTGAPTDAAGVNATAEQTSPQNVDPPTESAVQTEQDAVDPDQEPPLSNDPTKGTPTVQERAEQLERERLARQAEEERRILEAEIVQVEQRGLSRTFTEGMRAARLEPLKEQLALLDADPAQYFRMKRDGAFAPGREQSSNRSRSNNRRSRDRMP
jgi:hypothetical protein